MLDSPDELVVRCAQAVMHFTDLMAYLASPRIVAKRGQLPTQKHLLEHADEYLEVVTASDGRGVDGRGDDLRLPLLESLDLG
jgi:hypothetical protein